MKVAFSPCPNDTALFYAWVHGIVGKSLPIEPVLTDIQDLNEMALSKKCDILKISFHCFGKVLDQYELLPVGSALGFSCGPLIIAKHPFSLDELLHKRIAIPGKETTAHLLFDLFASHLNARKHFCLYHEITSLLQEDLVDAGVIIHENRFTYAQEGFFEVADLGKMWYNLTSLPIPLGCLVARRDLPNKTFEDIVAILRKSYAYFLAHPEELWDYVLHHSQIKEKAIIRKHISLYVNQETGNLSHKGYKSIETLLEYGVKLGHFPEYHYDTKTNHLCAAK